MFELIGSGHETVRISEAVRKNRWFLIFWTKICQVEQVGNNIKRQLWLLNNLPNAEDPGTDLSSVESVLKCINRICFALNENKQLITRCINAFKISACNCGKRTAY